MVHDTQHYDDARNEPQISIMAIGSMVAGILGLSLLPAIGSIIALGLGYAARSDLRAKDAVKGEGLATAGIVLGWLGVGLAIVGTCLAFWAILLGLTAFPGLTICGALSGGF